MGATFTPPGPRSTAAVLALYVKVGACVLAVGADVRRIVVAGRLGEGRALPDELLAADQLVAFGALVELVAFLVAAGLFLRWQVIAHRNVAALGGAAEPRVGAGVAAWFIPGVNLVRPRRVIGELWRAGEPARRSPPLLSMWWVAWLLALASVIAVWTLLGEAADIAQRQRFDALRAAATTLSALAAALAIAVVSQTSTRQERRARDLGAPRASAPAPPVESVSEGGLRVVSEERAQGLQDPDEAR